MTVGERMKKLRLSLGMSQVDFADKLNVSKQTLYKYENNLIANIPSDKIESAAKIGNVTPGSLMGWETPQNKSNKSLAINVQGHVFTNTPIDTMVDIIATEELPEALAKTGEFFGLQIHGDSMEPKMSDGDIVIVRKQNDAQSDEIVIVSVNGDDATCKRLKKYADGIALLSTNPTYAPMYFSQKDIEEKPVRIIGRVVELRAKL